jgi:hypothetical protein
MVGLTNSEIKKIVNRYIGVSNGYLGDFSYRTHTDFYPEYCDLDIDPNQYEGTTRQRFITILENSAPDIQAKIVRSIRFVFPLEAKDKPDTRTKSLYDDLLEIVGRLEDNQLNNRSTVAKPNKQISILLLSADPSDASGLRIGEEFRNIQEKLQLAKLRDFFKIDYRLSARPADISQALLDLQPQIVHFSGHGTHDGKLCFENQSGKIQSVSPEALTALFEQFSDHTECVLLNACYSETQAFAIAEHINYVIGMNQAIGDSAAIAFAIGFYQAMGSGRSVEKAYKLGCVQIQLQGIPEHLTPVIVQKKKKI